MKKDWKTYTPADLKSKSSLTASSASAAGMNFFII